MPPQDIVYERVLLLCKQRDITIKQLEKEIGLSNGAIGKWRASYPSAATLATVAVYFNVSTDYLVGMSDIPKRIADFNLDTDMQELTSLYYSMSEGERKRMMTMLRAAFPSAFTE